MSAPTFHETKPMFGNPVSSSNDGTDYTQNFQVHYNGMPTASAQDLQILETRAINASGIPRINDTFRGNSDAFCKSKTAAVFSDQDNNKPSYIIVTCIFSTKASDTSDEEDDPLKKLPDIDWSPVFETHAIRNAIEVEVIKDGSQIGGDIAPIIGGAQVNEFGIPMANSCGDPFDPFPERQVPYMQVTVTQNMAIFDPKEAKDKIQKINKEPFTIAGVTLDTETALCTSRSASNQFQGGIIYWKVTTTFLIKDSHKLIQLDAGLNRYKVKSTKFQSSFDPDDKTEITVDSVSSPSEQMLDGLGNPKTERASIFLHFIIFESTDFSNLGLPR